MEKSSEENKNREGKMVDAITVFILFWVSVGVCGGIFFLAEKVFLFILEFSSRRKEKQKFISPVRKWLPGATYSIKDILPAQKQPEKKRRGRKPGFKIAKKDTPISAEPEKKKYSRKPFAVPTIEEVKKYCDERKNGIDAARFFNFYTAKGWMIGKNKMKDWQAAVRTWERHVCNPAVPETIKTRFDLSREFSNSAVDTSLARRYLVEWMKLPGCMTDDQIRAVRGTSGILYGSLSEPQKAQIIQVFNDVRKKKGYIK